nr:hypothetical protein [uncultured Agathobaculum sp.]
MYYLNPKQNPSGAYPAPQSTPAAGLLPITDAQRDMVLQYGGFVRLSQGDEGETILMPDETAWRAWQAVQPSQLDAEKAAKQAQNKQALADWLAAHPLTWTDGNVYGVTEEDQNEMSLNLAQYQLAVAAEQPAVLEWHAQKQQCHSFTIEEYTALSLAIAAYVYPYRRYQETVKEAIYAAESKDELDAIEIDYGSVGAAA